MGKSVTVKSGFTDVTLPKVYTVPVSSVVAGGPTTSTQVLGVGGYNAGDVVVLTTAEFAALNAAQLGALTVGATVADPARPSADPKALAVVKAVATTGTIQLAVGVNQIGPVTGNVTLALASAGWSPGTRSSVIVEITNNGTAVITQPTGVKWAAGTVPTATATNGKIDIYEYASDDGGVTVFGRVFGQNY